MHAALGIILTSDGKLADHTSIQDAADGGNPGGFFGYATAWLEHQLRGNATAVARSPARTRSCCRTSTGRAAPSSERK